MRVRRRRSWLSWSGRRGAFAAALAAALLAACGGTAPGPALLPPAVAVGAAYRLVPSSPAVRAGRPVGKLRCGPARRRYGAHLELFVNGLVVLVPAGIGIAEPWVRDPPYVPSGRCEYPLVTREPTGVIEVASDDLPTLGDLFAIWGVPLGTDDLAGFPGHVSAYLDGRPYPGDPRGIPLGPHAQVVLEVGEHVAPHARYGFPAGL